MRLNLIVVFQIDRVRQEPSASELQVFNKIDDFWPQLRPTESESLGGGAAAFVILMHSKVKNCCHSAADSLVNWLFRVGEGYSKEP